MTEQESDNQEQQQSSKDDSNYTRSHCHNSITRTKSKSGNDIEETTVDHTVSREITGSKIIIIDNIKDPKSYCNSRDILSEFNKYFPDVEVEFGYLLPKGGIALHLKSKEARDRIIEEFPPGAFGGGVNPHRPKEQRNPFIYLKGVDTSIDIQLEEVLTGKGVKVNEITRLKNSFTGKPTKTVKILCKEDTWSILLTLALKFKGSHCQVEKEKESKVIQCFNCQRFGHLAKNCGRNQCCPHCGNEHPKRHCTLPAKCANCNGGHPAFSKACPEFTKRMQCLAAQYPEQ